MLIMVIRLITLPGNGARQHSMSGIGMLRDCIGYPMKPATRLPDDCLMRGGDPLKSRNQISSF
jgi:hypothetical protein